jgi:hypothetical protein
VLLLLTGLSFGVAVGLVVLVGQPPASAHEADEAVGLGATCGGMVGALGANTLGHLGADTAKAQWEAEHPEAPGHWNS